MGICYIVRNCIGQLMAMDVVLRQVWMIFTYWLGRKFCPHLKENSVQKITLNYDKEATLMIDTADKHCVYGLFFNNIIHYIETNNSGDQIEKIDIRVDLLLKSAALNISEIKNLIINTGPGGFNSIRAGASYVAGLSAGLKIKVKQINTFDIIRKSLDIYEQFPEYLTDCFDFKGFNIAEMQNIPIILKSGNEYILNYNQKTESYSNFQEFYDLINSIDCNFIAMDCELNIENKKIIKILKRCNVVGQFFTIQGSVESSIIHPDYVRSPNIC